jgi:16S rRNA (uracil1498-N3)-methyltransferase
MDTVVQKVTELGVSRISPVLTDYSAVRLDDARSARRTSHWTKIAQSACEQCGRNIVPDVDELVSLVDWFGKQSRSGSLILQPGAQRPMSESAPEDGQLTILIGPEGGFSDVEYGRASATGMIAVSLGPRILRTETAAIAAVSMAQSVWGDWSGN